MTAGEVVLEALANEQARLAELPFDRPRTDSFDEYYGGKLVLVECWGSGREPEPARRANLVSTCRGCHLKAVEDLVDGGVMVRHAKALMDYDQAERVVGVVCAVLGFEEWSDAGTYARAAIRDESARRLGPDGQLARAVAYLAEQLVRRDATSGARAALEELATYTRERAEHPLFTEAGLYDLLGKDEARSVLSRLRTLTTAMGGVES